MMNEKDNSEEEEGFIIDLEGLPGFFEVFEDDRSTGYLYLYEQHSESIMNHLRIYVRTPDTPVEEDDVQVEWSRDMKKVGVRIWGEMRGIINLEPRKEGRAIIESRDSPGIGDPEWFERFI